MYFMGQISAHAQYKKDGGRNLQGNLMPGLETGIVAVRHDQPVVDKPDQAKASKDQHQQGQSRFFP